MQKRHRVTERKGLNQACSPFYSVLAVNRNQLSMNCYLRFAVTGTDLVIRTTDPCQIRSIRPAFC